MDPLLLVHISNCWRQLHNNAANERKRTDSDAERARLDEMMALCKRESALADELVRQYSSTDSYGASVLYAEVRR